MNTTLLVILVISLVLQIVAVSTDHWAKYRPQDNDTGLYYGLWKVCRASNTCMNVSDISDQQDLDLGVMIKNLKVIQAFSIIGIIMTAVLIVMLFMNYPNTMVVYLGAIIACVIAVIIWITKYAINTVTIGTVASKSVPDWSYYVYLAGVVMLPAYLVLQH